MKEHPNSEILGAPASCRQDVRLSALESGRAAEDAGKLPALPKNRRSAFSIIRGVAQDSWDLEKEPPNAQILGAPASCRQDVRPSALGSGRAAEDAGKMSALPKNRRRASFIIRGGAQDSWELVRMQLRLALASKGLLAGILGAIVGLHPAIALADDYHQNGQGQRTIEPDRSLPGPRHANFEQTRPPAVVRQMADWVVNSGDSQGMPFVLVDKIGAKVYVFHADGRLRGASPALLGLAVGDDAVPGIGERKLASILPQERTTPAGRFVASMDRNLQGGEILWVDYEGAISLHPVITSKPKERRAQRLATASPLDNRISYGCINVPAAFFKNVVSMSFKNTSGIVYVLPETRPVRTVFAQAAKPSEQQ